MEQETSLSVEARQVTRAAALISFGNVTSRILGLAREMVKSHFFGAGGAVSAFDVASQVPTMLYDQFIGGMLNSALVPAFSDYVKPKHQAELWRLLSLLLSVLSFISALLILGVEIFAEQITSLLSGGLNPVYLAQATQMLRITAPAIFFLNVAGLFSATLYALERFERPAFIAAIYNAVLVSIVLLLGNSQLGVYSLAIGLLLGSAAQVAMQFPALKDADLRLIFPLKPHPALKTIGKLYLPIGLGLIVDQLAVMVSFNIASRTGPSGIAWMKYAATLIQFPLGMVVTAVSIAILPTLARYANDEAEEEFRTTLAQGLRMVLILVLPAAMAMLILAEPIVALLFQHGSFTSADTSATAEALRYNLLGLVFASLDQPLIFAFYARKNTWTPALVGVVTVILYAGIAIIPTLLHEPRLAELILANSLKLTAHALLMLWLFNYMVGSLRPNKVGRTTGIALGASVVMAIPMLGARVYLESMLKPGITSFLVLVIVPGIVGLLVYLLVLRLMGVEETFLIQEIIQRTRNKAGHK
ncbi:MAG: murein biosynthesis integral membrane protein MurJ [Anaerolineae bacterium]|nr:murein biosynthesis integral membrane protein MurJ [Anaerolineae bacterium]